MKFVVQLCCLLLLSAVAHAQKKIVGTNAIVNPYNYSIVKNKTYSTASVACAHPLAAMCGSEVMKQGGNAFDAAITTQLVLAVVYPGAGNIGGGGFMVARTKNKFMALDYRETAPAKAFEKMYLDKEGNAQTQLSQDGHLAAGVPGTIAGIFEIMPYAKLPFATLIQPAIDIAEYGFVITEREAANLNKHQDLFKKCNTHLTQFERATLWKAGDTLIQKDLANTLKRIQQQGRKGFYEGKTAQLIVDEMQRGNGIISLKDLKNYKAVWRKPLQFDYKGYHITTMPPPSSGGIILCQLMQMMQYKKSLLNEGYASAKAVQLMIEAERRVYADRATHLGDPDFIKVPVKTLTSKQYIENRLKGFDSTKATASSNITAGNIPESEETTHISIVDAAGNMVSITTTLNGSYGSKTVVGGAGFILNNEMDDFSIKPGVANMYGAVGGKANAIAAHKRMLSSMTPTIVTKNNQPVMIVGTPGGTTIPTSVFQTLMNIIEFGMNANDAVNKPKFHHQWLPDEVFVEKDFNKSTCKQLQTMGYKITERLPIGRVELLQLHHKQIEAVADSRGDDCVSGW